MSKYNVGDKFIIEISKNDTNELDTTEYYITNGSRVYEKEELDRLQKYEEVQIPHSEAYNKGLEDAWEFLKAFCGMDVGERQKVFGEYVVGKLVENMSPQEALAMIETYEKEQAEIKVGDVVEIESTKKCYVILAIYGKTIWGYSCEGDLSPLQELDGVTITKTGKHIDITCVLEQIKE